MQLSTSFVVILVAIALGIGLPTPALAHSPIYPKGNHSLANAYQVNDPAKSWAINSSLDHPDQGDYYRFTVAKEDKIEIELMASDRPFTSGFLPSFALLVPSLVQSDRMPSYIEVPSGYGAIVVDGTDPSKASYEPFSPGWLSQALKGHDWCLPPRTEE